MRILAVGNMYPPHHQGGYELVWQAVMRRARAAGHEIRVLASDHREPEPHGQEDPDVHRVLRWYWSYEDYRFPELGIRARVELERFNRERLTTHIESFRPDLVTWWGMGCMSLSLIEQVRRRGLPALFCVHDDWLVYGRKADQWMRIWRGRRRLAARPAELVVGVPTSIDLRGAGPLVFNSRYTLSRAAEAGVDTSTASVVTPGVDNRFLTALPPHPWRWRLLYVGRLDRQKGVDTAVASLAWLPEGTTLRILGTGDATYVSELHQAAQRMGAAERVEFAGFGGQELLLSEYDRADAVVFPVRWEEPWGLVPLEAMGLGRPVIATTRGGTGEFIRDGENALTFPADNPRELAERVTQLASDDRLRDRLRAGGSRTAARHTLDQFERKMLHEIERAGARTS